MNIYYVPNSRTDRYGLETILPKGCKEIYQIKNEISKIPGFCGNEDSISLFDLKSYLNGGITLYSSNSSHEITGVLNFDVNEPSIYIYGLCVPSYAKGAGTQFLNALKKIGESNHLENIKLECYGSVVNFYLKNGFQIVEQSEFYEDSYNSDEENNNSKTKYKMIYNLNNKIVRLRVGAGGKKKKTNKIRKNKQIKRIKNKSNKRNKRTRRKT